MTIFNDPSVVKGMIMGFALGALSFTAATAWIVRGLQRTEKEMIQSLNEFTENMAETAEMFKALVKELKDL